jgi:hypothetical protein
MFVESMEAISIASFLNPTEKQPYVRLAVRKMDTLRILLMVLWETKSIDDIGKMLGGWQGQIAAYLVKQNSPGRKSGEK